MVVGVLLENDGVDARLIQILAESEDVRNDQRRKMCHALRNPDRETKLENGGVTMCGQDAESLCRTWLSLLMV